MPSLVHFAVLRLLPEQHPILFQTTRSGYAAILAYALGGIVVVGVTYAISWCSYHTIERPMMRLARNVARRNPLTAA